ncbi:MAG: hypothetical protein RLZZ373_3211 [Pseudomonadota bacterium]|jgi:hypothetical protein
MHHKDHFAAVQVGANAGAMGANSLPDPTDAQKRAGNYRMGRIEVMGLRIGIENPQGTERRGVDPDGVPWCNRMAAHYGSITGTRGADGDAIDVFVGPMVESGAAWVINQCDPHSRLFDEHKVMLGFTSEADARSGYLRSYTHGWKGLGSIVQTTESQLRWWLAHGDHTKPVSAESLPHPKEKPVMTRTNWTGDAEPAGSTLDRVLYDLRRADGPDGLIFDAVTMDDLLGDSDVEHQMLDALVVEVGMLQPKMQVLQRLMDAAGGADLKTTGMVIGDPARKAGTMQVPVVWPLSDGQAIAVWLHNPDTTPAKLSPADSLVSWKWLLNKLDVTLVVAPERGTDLNPREVARRLMKLAVKNSPAFQRVNAGIAARAEAITAIKGEIIELEARESDLKRQLDVKRAAPPVDAASAGLPDIASTGGIEDLTRIADAHIAAGNDFPVFLGSLLGRYRDSHGYVKAGMIDTQAIKRDMVAAGMPVPLAGSALQALFSAQKVGPVAKPVPKAVDPKAVDSNADLAKFGMVTITDLGSENVYFTGADGIAYFTKLLEPDDWKLGEADFSSLGGDPAPAPVAPPAPQATEVTIASKTRVRDEDGNMLTRVTLSDGSVHDLQRSDSTSTMGVPGWHVVRSNGRSLQGESGTYRGDTEAQAVHELVRLHNMAAAPAPVPAAFTPSPEWKRMSASEYRISDPTGGGEIQIERRGKYWVNRDSGASWPSLTAAQEGTEAEISAMLRARAEEEASRASSGADPVPAPAAPNVGDSIASFPMPEGTEWRVIFAGDGKYKAELFDTEAGAVVSAKSFGGPGAKDDATGYAKQQADEANRIEARDPLPAKPVPPAPPKPLPASVVQFVTRAIDRLTDLKSRMETARTGLDENPKIGGGGRYESEVWRGGASSIAQSNADLEKIRGLAQKNGNVAEIEALIVSLGGVPDVTPSAKAAAWTISPAPVAPTPDPVQPAGGDMFGGDLNAPKIGFSDFLKSGRLQDAIEMLAGMKYDAAQEILANAGFGAYSRTKTTAALIESTQAELVKAVKARTDGWGLREAQELEILKAAGDPVVVNGYVVKPAIGVSGDVVWDIEGFGRGFTTKEYAISRAKALPTGSEITATPDAENTVDPEGKENEVKTAKGTKVMTGFTVIEAARLITSNDPETGNTNPDYPAELQPRDRKRETSRAWVIKTAADLDPDQLGKTRRADTGAPIIGRDRVVESGNGRCMAILLAYKKGTADEYRQWLTDEAESFGVKASRVQGMVHPVLVRVRTSEIDRKAFTVEANQDDKLSMTATEKAKADADRLDDATIALMTENGDLTAQENIPFLSAFLRSLGDAEAAQYSTSDGKPTSTLIARVQAAIFAKAYNDERLLELTADVAKPEIANIVKALNHAAPEFIQAAALDPKAAKGATGKLVDGVEQSLNAKAVEALLGAAGVIRQAKEAGQTVDEFVKQSGLFGDIDPDVAAMAVFISKNNRSAARMGAAFKAMAVFIKAEILKGQTTDMFGDSQPVAFADIVAAANRELERVYGEGAQTISLFDKPVAEPMPVPAAEPPAAPQDFTHAGRLISKQIRSRGGEAISRWIVQTDENAARVAAGDRPLGGDRVADSEEEAKTIAEEMNLQRDRDAAWKAEIAAKDELAAKEKAARQSATEGKSLAEIKAMDYLNADVRFEGEMMPRSKFVETLVSRGSVPSMTMVNKVRPMTRNQQRVASNEDTRAHERKVAAGGKVPEYWLGEYSVSKTEFDHAQKLIAAAPDPTPQESEHIAFLRTVVAGDKDQTGLNSLLDEIDSAISALAKSGELAGDVEALANEAITHWAKREEAENVE